MLDVILSPQVLPWILICVGALFLLIEASSPGFFMAVPGTAFVVIGVFSFFAYDLLATPAGIIVAVVAAVVAAVLTVLVYKKISPDRKPITVTKDTITGKKGVVTVEINEKDISGKVEINGAVWSAKSSKGTIPVGAEVEVESSSGVHLTVKEV